MTHVSVFWQALCAHCDWARLDAINLIGIPITNLSVNPARSTGPAFVVADWALQQRWLFWLASLGGALAAGLTYPAVAADRPSLGEESIQVKKSVAHGSS